MFNNDVRRWFKIQRLEGTVRNRVLLISDILCRGMHLTCCCPFYLLCRRMSWLCVTLAPTKAKMSRAGFFSVISLN
jgi:hypothetical protein